MDKLQLAEQFRRAVQLFAATLDNEKAMMIATIYDKWMPDRWYDEDEYFVYGTNEVGDPQLYQVAQGHTSSYVYPPGSPGTEALYTPIGLNEDGYPVWSPPTGAHDAYDEGDIVDYNGTLYMSKINGNTTVPGTDERYWTIWEG